VVDDIGGAWVTVDAAPIGLHRLAFQRVPEPKTVKNRVHLDLRADDRRATVDRLVGLGAELVADHEIPELAWSVLRDPEGNEFCVG
jgi:predicted enzyme related to lactoylglutathione lyase